MRAPKILANILGALIERSFQFPYAGAVVSSAIVELSSLGAGNVVLLDEEGSEIARTDFDELGSYANTWSLEEDGRQD